MLSITLSRRYTHQHTKTAVWCTVHKLMNTTGYLIFMTGLSGVTTVHIHLFGFNMIDVFFMLPLGLK